MSKTIYRKEYRALVALLREGREAAGLTQADMASRLGTVQARVSDIERGGRRLDVLEFIDFCTAAGIDPTKVLSRALKAAD